MFKKFTVNEILHGNKRQINALTTLVTDLTNIKVENEKVLQQILDQNKSLSVEIERAERAAGYLSRLFEAIENEA